MLAGCWFASERPAKLATRAPRATTPVQTETAKLFDPAIKYVGHFGRALACADETLVVGALYDDTGTDYSDGAVSVFARAGAGWQLQQKLSLQNGKPNDNFGAAVALEGDTLAVGARGGQISAAANAGLALVYTRSGGHWTLQQVLSAADGGADDYFGTTVALAGDTLVVGNSAVALERRALYVFRRAGGTWRQVQKLNSSGPAAVWGDTLVLTVLTGLEQSAVQFYTRHGESWVRQQELTGDPSTTAFSTGFGSALALNENYLAVGAPAEARGPEEPDEGRVYLFQRSGAGWVRQQKLAASDAAAHDQFGVSLALAGETLAVGALYSNEDARPEAGAAYVFKHEGAGWTERLRALPSDSRKGERFGQTVALAERVLLVGAHLHGRRSVVSIPGAAYVYELAPPSLLVNVSAASYAGQPLAPESIVTAFGAGLAGVTQTAGETLPETLAGTSVKLTDSAGTARLARLFFVSPGQLNYQIPPGTAHGTASVTVTNRDRTVALAQLQIEPVAPGLFTADASGRGWAAAVVLRVKPDGTQSFEPVTRFDPVQNELAAAPIELGRVDEQVFLILFGTGLRLHGGLSGVHATAGGAAADVSFAGAQGAFLGLDQVNLRLPPSLAGRGDVEIGLTINGKTANPVRIFIK